MHQNLVYTSQTTPKGTPIPWGNSWDEKEAKQEVVVLGSHCEANPTVNGISMFLYFRQGLQIVHQNELQPD